MTTAKMHNSADVITDMGPDGLRTIVQVRSTNYTKTIALDVLNDDVRLLRYSVVLTPDQALMLAQLLKVAAERAQSVDA